MPCGEAAPENFTARAPPLYSDSGIEHSASLDGLLSGGFAMFSLSSQARQIGSPQLKRSVSAPHVPHFGMISPVEHLQNVNL